VQACSTAKPIKQLQAPLICHFTIVYGELGRDKRLLVEGDEKTLQAKLEELMSEPKLL
jgi:hypothetical protein